MKFSLYQFLKYWITIFSIPLACSSNYLYGQSETVTTYEYDGAGNIIRVNNQQQFGAPEINNFSPDFINRGRSRSFTVLGNNLIAVEVSTDHEGLTIAAIQSTIGKLTFTLSASLNADLGDASIRISNGLGEVVQTIVVAEQLVELVSNPAPIVVEPSSVTPIRFQFLEPRTESETYQLSIGDPAIASLSESSITVSPGETEFTLNMLGQIEGATSLEITLQEKYFFYSFPVFVSSSFSAFLLSISGDPQTLEDITQRSLFGEPVRIFKESDNESNPSVKAISPLIGITYIDVSGFYAPPVAVTVSDGNAIRSPLTGILVGEPFGAFSAMVGIDVGAQSDFYSDIVAVEVSNLNPFYSAETEVVKGPLLDDFNNLFSLPVDSTSDIVVQGQNLTEVQMVIVEPSDDIVINNFSVNADGTTLTVNISVAASASLGSRELQLNTNSESVGTRSGENILLMIE